MKHSLSVLFTNSCNLRRAFSKPDTRHRHSSVPSETSNRSYSRSIEGSHLLKGFAATRGLLVLYIRRHGAVKARVLIGNRFSPRVIPVRINCSTSGLQMRPLLIRSLP